ncbi:MAG TPA: hypothetical protein PLY80_22560, partial [Pseudomonadota bacterium]|nr:hypothetical protein [Pseudomonadota bacterium]
MRKRATQAAWSSKSVGKEESEKGKHSDNPCRAALCSVLGWQPSAAKAEGFWLALRELEASACTTLTVLLA